MASNRISKPARSQPPSVGLNSHDYGFQVCTITATKCICKLVRLRSPNSLDASLQVHLQTCSITASECIFNLARLWSANSHDLRLQIRTITDCTGIPKLARLRSPNSLHHSLKVYLWTQSITASECMSRFSRSQCGETMQVNGRQPIINTSPYLAWYPKGILEKERP